jgi:hypothetical protein
VRQCYRRTQFHCKCGYILRMRTAAPLGGKQTIGPVRQGIRVKLQASVGAPPPPSILTGGSNWSLRCEEEEDLDGAEWNQGRHG